MGLGIPPPKNNMMLESNPLKPTMFVGRLGVSPWVRPAGARRPRLGRPPPAAPETKRLLKEARNR